MRAFLQKFRNSTSSKGSSNGYTSTSKELEKEKRFPPLPEWPPPALNNSVKEPAIAPSSVAPTIPISLETTSSTVKTPSSVPSTGRPFSNIDSELPPLPSFAEPLVDAGKLDDKTRKRNSNTNSVATITDQTRRQAGNSLDKEPVTNSVAGAPSQPPPPVTGASSFTAAPKLNGTAITSPPAGNTVEERRKANNSEPVPSKTVVTKLIGVHEGRGSTSTSHTVGTIKTAAAKVSASTRALMTSPTPGSAHHHPSGVPSHLNRQHPRHQPHGRYNAMGLPMADNVSIIRPGTSMSQVSQRSAALTTASWSEAAEEDLVTHLGQRERTRQEVLWEIVASEQRYVTELMVMRESIIVPLLHPFATNPLAAQSDEDYYNHESPVQSVEHLPIASRFLNPPASLRAPTPSAPGTPGTNITRGTPVIPTPDQESDSDHDDHDEATANAGKLLGQTKKKMSLASSAAAKANHPRSPYGTASRASGAKASAINPKLGRIVAQVSSRSHQSLPPPPRSITAPAGANSTTSLGRKSANDDREKEVRPSTTDPGHGRRRAHFAPSPPPGRVLKKTRRDSEEKPKLVSFPGAVPPHVLPEDLRICLEVIENGIIPGHLTLSEALRKRYDEQYPLVRSLADVFVGNAEILHQYATYVLHLERALEQVSNYLNMNNVMKRSRQPESADDTKLAKLLFHLEQEAAIRSETGIAISLSKPFQRLLKYPLLFQNLLFHTDPSTFEYESTLEMVSEVESIVRSIEDEKIQKEERDKTRDSLARIDGLEKDKVLAVFKPSRLLIEERPQPGSFADLASKAPPPSAMNTTRDKGVKQKTSFRRISDVLTSKEDRNGLGSKRDLWIVEFNDVELLCQRVGTTTLPLSANMNTRSNSNPDGQGKPKYASTNGRRASAQARPRNLYRFLKVESWKINEKPKPRELVSKEAIERWRTQQTGGHLAVSAEDEEEEEEAAADSDDSDRKSKMSFSYWGADKVTLTRPMARRGAPSTNASRTQLRNKLQAPSSFAGRDPAMESKFGTRLRSPEPSVDGSVVSAVRPSSRRTGPTASPHVTRRNITSTVDSKATAGSTASLISNRPGGPGAPTLATTTIGAPVKRIRNSSVTSGGSRIGNVKTLSAVPSEDSGVGMYRQIIAHDPSISSVKS
ncbi:hypothetical protein FRC17_010145 [Serendipita sp. 399]|nr:hypothetical protein FRC17_010145 [Serendipita sp. 399]